MKSGEALILKLCTIFFSSRVGRGESREKGVVAQVCLKADNVHRILTGPEFKLQKSVQAMVSFSLTHFSHFDSNCGP